MKPQTYERRRGKTAQDNPKPPTKPISRRELAEIGKVGGRACLEVMEDAKKFLAGLGFKNIYGEINHEGACLEVVGYLYSPDEVVEVSINFVEDQVVVKRVPEAEEGEIEVEIIEIGKKPMPQVYDEISKKVIKYGRK